MAGDFIPTGIFTEADPDGLTLTINNTTGDWTTQTGLPVAGPTNTAEGTWDSYTGNDATLSAVTGRWIGTNGADTNFSIAGPKGIPTPFPTADIELVSSGFKTDPEGADTLQKMVWNINGVDREAPSNPWKPGETILGLNNSVTVNVRHVGIALGTSEPSTNVTFTTGAVRNAGAYYQAKLAALEARLDAANL